jgi:multicomponent Na+:H+ antiporter subunit E
VRHATSLAVCLFAFWLLLSGNFVPFLIGSGVIAALAVTWFARRMEVADSEGHPIHMGLGALFSYWPWLVWEIVKSAWTVARIIVDPRLPISPTLVRFKPRQHSAVGLVTHANSITLTPGTISVEVRPQEFVVHALTREGARAVADSEMDRRVERLEARR